VADHVIRNPFVRVARVEQQVSGAVNWLHAIAFDLNRDDPVW
jgi:hypothetical protein